MTNQKPASFALRGGLDLETPSMEIRRGMCIGASNYEPTARGYRRTGGYERFDGRPRPSDAAYWLLPFDAGTSAIVLGNTVTGGTSGATGKVIVAPTLDSGSWAGGDAAGTLILGNVAGAFQDDEPLEVSAVQRATSAGTAAKLNAADPADDATWLKAAVEDRRAAIQKPAGEGAINGVFGYQGTVYAIRDKIGGAAAEVFASSAIGWQAVPGVFRLPFSSGSTEPQFGDILVGATNGGTLAVLRVVRTSGAWADGDAAGYVIGAPKVGGFLFENVNVQSGPPNVLTTTGETAVTIPAGGRWRHAIGNARGSIETRSVYLVSGVGRALEFSPGGWYAPIETGLAAADDKPTHVALFKNHLFLAYPNGSVLFSEIGEPLLWSTTGGGGEIAVGHEPTGLLVASGVLVIFCKTAVFYLTGNDAADFQLVELSRDSGCLADTAQMVDTPHYFGGRNLRRLTSTEALGGWRMGSVTPQIERLWRAKGGAGVAPVASWRVRGKDHYVIALDDKTGVTVYLGRRNSEAMPFTLPFQMRCADASDEIGGERVFVGAEDGYVYEMDAGRSFDGADVSAYLILAPVTVGHPHQVHRWHEAFLELETGGEAAVKLSADFDYGDPDLVAAPETSLGVQGGGGRWNVDNWNEFIWSARTEGTGRAPIQGIGRNCVIGILSDADFELPHTLSVLTLNTTPRGVVR